MSNYKATRQFKSESIREMCVRHNFYTCGNNKEYSAMLKKESLKPTVSVIESIAVDILSHSNQEWLTVEFIMFIIEDECVETFYSHK